jgi:hypothetical protein
MTTKVSWSSTRRRHGSSLKISAEPSDREQSVSMRPTSLFPPATSTVPSESSVEVCAVRGVPIEAVTVNEPVAGS